MKVYIFIYFFILMNSFIFFISSIKNSKIEKNVFRLTLTGLILFSGTRYFTGVDYESYLKIFQEVDFSLNINEVEKLFLLIAYFLREFVKLTPYNTFLFFEIISGVLLYKLIDKNLNKNLLFALYIWYSLYFLRLNMGQFRFGISVLICLNIISYLYNNAYKKFSLGVIISFFVHKTSIIYFLSLLIKRKIFSNKNLLFFPLIGLFIGKTLINKESLLIIANTVGSNKLHSMVYGKYINNVGFSFYQLYIILVSTLLCCYKTKNSRIILLKKIFSLGVGMYFLFINLAIFSDRLSLIFISVQTILFPMIINNFNKKINKISIFIFVIIICSYIFFSTIVNSPEYIPYKSWLFL